MVGMLGIIAFLLTGQYMDRFHGHLAGMSNEQRLLFRSTHIYLLLASAIHIPLGLYFHWPAGRFRKGLIVMGSTLLIAAPIMLLIGFAREPWMTELARPFTRPALFGTLAGIVLHLLGGIRIGRADDQVKEMSPACPPP
jgi:hypothetical protein